MTSLTRLPVFGYGFRPFFLVGPLFAAVAVPAWLVIHAAGVSPLAGLPARLWHGHEMLFGFVIAAVAGFLLSAVPGWTGRRGFAGWPALTLTLAWLAGRMAMATASLLPWAVLALLELALLPLLIALLAPPLIRERNRNMVMLAVLGALWAADAAFLLAVLRGDAGLASTALQAAMNILLLLVTIVGGRVVPAFTGYVLRRAGETASLRSTAWVERVLPALMIAAVIGDAGWPQSALAGALSALLAALHGYRLSGWRSLRFGADPVLWVLHLAYAWLPLGYVLKAVAVTPGTAWASYWPHAFAIGTLATMIVAVASRTSLGHTGRPTRLQPAIAWACALLALAAAIRVGGPALWPQWPLAVLAAAAACWTVAFGLFLALYGPILTRPRVDGRTG